MRSTLGEHHPVLLCEVHHCNAQYVELMTSLGYETVNLDADVPVEQAAATHTPARPRTALAA